MYDELKVRPRTAIALYTDGAPWYPYRNTLSSEILYVNTPVLPNPHATWSRLFRGDMRLHIDLEDERTLAELLCCTRNPDDRVHLIDPALIDPTNLIQRLERTLAECRCNPGVLAGYVADEYGDFQRAQPLSRMATCRERARFLLGTNLAGGGVG